MNKKLIRLTESDLHRIVKESVDKILNEIGDTPRGRYMLGRLQQRAINSGDKNLDDELSDRYEKGWKNNRDGYAWNSGMGDQRQGVSQERVQQRYNAFKQ